MPWEILATVVLVLISLTIQLLTVISVPVTGSSIGFNLYLSRYRNFAFGVLGVCNYVQGVCSKSQVGYPPSSDMFYTYINADEYSQNEGAILPSRARYTISKLLVVHILAFIFSCMLLVTMIILIIVLRKNKHREKKLNENGIELEGKTNIDHLEENSHGKVEQNFRKMNELPFLNLMFSFASLGFILNLLAFLADILLFIPNLSYLGWLQIFPIVTLAIVCSYTCIYKRTLSSRKYLDVDSNTSHDDMRIRRKLHEPQWSDTESDDGFYVYANGFFSLQGSRNGDSQFHLVHKEEGESEAQVLHPVSHARYNNSDSEQSIYSVTESDDLEILEMEMSDDNENDENHDNDNNNDNGSSDIND